MIYPTLKTLMAKVDSKYTLVVAVAKEQDNWFPKLHLQFMRVPPTDRFLPLLRKSSSLVIYRHMNKA